MTENQACRVGVAQRKITPPLGSELGGYFHKRFAKGVKSELYAKVMVIESGGRRLALAANDLVAAFAEFTGPARERVARQCGIPPEAILITSTHTHTGPALVKRKGNPVDPVPGYNEVVATAIAEAAQEACASMFEATLYLGETEAPGYSVNKLSRTRDGRDVYRQPKPGDPDIIGPAGQLDTSVQVLCVRDARQQIRALAVNFAAHPNSGGEEIWAEWPGDMVKTLAAVYGADMPCLFLQGTCGDVDCRGRDRVGRGIAGAAMLALEREKTPAVCLPLDYRFRKLTIPRLKKTPETDRMIEAIRSKPNPNYLEKAWPLRYDAWDPEPASRDVPVQCFRLGDTAIIALPGEAFTALGLEIKRYSPARHTLIVAYANDSIGYIPPVEQAHRGGYGEWPFISRQLIAEAGTMMTEAAIEMLHEMWAGGSQAAATG